ncbi:rod shape-determining protein MreC [Ligilactobacillus sp. WC1T17]|uniref:Cell shape-determining protein MreC n=1 Tax=Ligilactobacillus ruminis TaxID=1623 RepID=A0ABY1AAU5_9LACO|nr:rod shape-determining protein MreC [Ligilactobacillus ruminis]
MQKFFFNKKLVVTLIGLIVAFLLVAFSINVRNNRSMPPVIQQIGNEASGLVNAIVSYPATGIAKAGSAVGDLLNTYQENQKLKKQVDSLAAQKVENQTLRQENKQLKQQVKLNKSLTDYDKISAYVLSRTPSAWQNQVIISKGRTAGVVKNAAVMSKEGLVGRVVEVNQTNSKVELVTTKNDSANRFSVQLINTKNEIVNGLITGYNTEKNQLIMGQVTSKVKIKKGTKVITSGMGGNTPKGLFVGTVVRVADDDYGLPSKIYIKPAADMTNLNVVTVAKRTD